MSCPYCGKGPSPIPKVAPFCSVLHKQSFTAATAERKERERLENCPRLHESVEVDGIVHRVAELRTKGSRKIFWTEWKTGCMTRVGGQQVPYPTRCEKAFTCLECIAYKPPPELPWTSRTPYRR